jgi:O-Antigen ligase
MIELANDRWFPIVNLSLATAAATLWYLSSGRIGWPLLVAILVPWVLRIAAGHFPFRRSRFDGLLLIFGITAVISTFTAYDRDLARGKFWILLGAMAIYFAIVSVSRRDVWRLAAVAGPLGASLAIYFVMSNNWQQWPAEIGLLNRIGGMWMALRPSLPLPVLHPNMLGGMMALLLPFTIAFGIYAWRKREIRWVQLAVVSGGITVAGLLFSSSIGAWLAVAVGLGIWFLWETSGKLGRKSILSQKMIFIGLMAGLSLFGLLLLGFLLRSGAGQEDSATRLGLARQTLFLIEDFGLTGSGLATFPALYAQYVQVTPVFFAAYSNFFLDIWLEQGFFALISMLIVLGGSFWLLLKRSAFSTKKRVQQPANFAKAEAVETTGRSRRRRRRNKPISSGEMVLFRWAAFASMVVMILHGLIDDALYGAQASPLLFFAPAMVILVTRRRQRAAAPSVSRWVMGLGATAVLLLGLFIGLRQTVQAQWVANLGALELARAELVGWPTDRWDAGEDLQRFDAATALFEQALTIDPQNRTANHRLGTIAMVKRDYETAVTHLEQSVAASDSYRGAIKSLGYSYVWHNQPDQAIKILSEIPESRREMSIYSSWWERQDRLDLAAKASEMAAVLENSTLLNP